MPPRYVIFVDPTSPASIIFCHLYGPGQDQHAILCSQHVHLDHHRCLEVILMQGTASQLRRVSDTIISTRGVKAGKLTLLSKNL